MPEGQDYAEQLGELRRHIAEPVRGIILLQFATIPQLQGIVAGLLAIDPERNFVEVSYDPPRENAAQYLGRARRGLSEHPTEPLPLLILRPLHLPDAKADHPAAIEFWRALNFRRETIGELPVQTLLCVDPWHHERLVDYAGDLRSWAAPKFRLLPLAGRDLEPSQGLAALSTFAKFDISAEAAEQRWKTFWPELEKAVAEHRLEPGHFRRYILPLMEAALAQGNLVRARQVRDAATALTPPHEDIVSWYLLNVMLACAAQDFFAAEDHSRKLLNIASDQGDERIRQHALNALSAGTSLLDYFGQSTCAENLIRQQYRLMEKVNGKEHPATLWTKNDLAVVLKRQGKYTEAEQEQRDLLSIRERISGSAHPDALASRNNLANILSEQGNHVEAEREHRAVLAIRQASLGFEHPDTLASRNNLASTLGNRGRHAEQEHEHRAVLASRERVLGLEHPDTLGSRINLAVALDAQGEHADAEQEYRTALKGGEKVLGPGHPDSLACRQNLANTLSRQGKLLEAEREHRAVLEIRELTHGIEHPHTLGTRNNLAVVLRNRGSFAEAEKEHRAILAIRNRVLGPNHPDTLASLNNLAIALESKGEYAEAEQEHRAILAVRERVLGGDHPDTIQSRNNLAECRQAQGKTAEG